MLRRFARVTASMSKQPIIETAGLIEQMYDLNKKRELTATRQFMFTKVGRTASESMHQQLLGSVVNYLRLGRVKQVVQYYREFDYTKINICHNHIPIRAMIAGKLFPSAWYDSLYKWGGCRNPWDRLVSFWRIKQDEQRGAGIAQNCNTLQELVTRLENKECRYFVPESNKYTIMQPMWRWLLPEFDYITRYEFLKQDWAKVVSDLGIPELVLTKHNAYHKQVDTAKRKSYLDYYDSRLARRVGILYKDDCKIFGYADIEDRTPFDQSRIKNNLKEHWSELGYDGASQ